MQKARSSVSSDEDIRRVEIVRTVHKAVATPCLSIGGDICWEWSYCPDCGVEGAHHWRMVDGERRFGVRCG